MNTQLTMGIDFPQLDLSNFISNETNRLDINKYFQTLGDITENIQDENVRNDIFHRYVNQRKERNQKFEQAYNNYFSFALDNTFNCQVRNTFLIGHFYTTKEVKTKLTELYNHEFAPLHYYKKAAKLVDLNKNDWFLTKYMKNPFQENGILIIDCLI